MGFGETYLPISSELHLFYSESGIYPAHSGLVPEHYEFVETIVLHGMGKKLGIARELEAETWDKQSVPTYNTPLLLRVYVPPHVGRSICAASQYAA